MKSGLKGFLCGAALASAGLLVLPEFAELTMRGGTRNGHTLEVIVAYARPTDGRAMRVDIEELPGFFRTHVVDGTFGPYVDRFESLDFVPRRFGLTVNGAESAMVAHARICPIVVVATSQELRVTPCLAPLR
jgi:hypothetical protein